jgi:hypothetical protein
MPRVKVIVPPGPAANQNGIDVDRTVIDDDRTVRRTNGPADGPIRAVDDDAIAAAATAQARPIPIADRRPTADRRSIRKAGTVRAIPVAEPAITNGRPISIADIDRRPTATANGRPLR